MSDKSFIRAFTSMIGALVGVAVVLFILANLIGGLIDDRLADERESAKQEEIAERVAPVGNLVIGQVATTVAQSAVTNANAAAPSGESVYQSSCSACHAAGVAGAPKLGDAAAWSERLAQGINVLEDHAINGFQGTGGMMPAKGGNTSLSDDDVRAAVAYMVETSK